MHSIHVTCQVKMKNISNLIQFQHYFIKNQNKQTGTPFSELQDILVKHPKKSNHFAESPRGTKHFIFFLCPNCTQYKGQVFIYVSSVSHGDSTLHKYQHQIRDAYLHGIHALLLQLCCHVVFFSQNWRIIKILCAQISGNFFQKMASFFPKFYGNTDEQMIQPLKPYIYQSWYKYSIYKIRATKSSMHIC